MIWRVPEGRELHEVAIYLRTSVYLDYGNVRVVDVAGDARLVLVVLSNGTLQAFSWHGKLRGQANPFLASAESARSRYIRSRSMSGSCQLPSRQGSSYGAEAPLSPVPPTPQTPAGSGSQLNGQPSQQPEVVRTSSSNSLGSEPSEVEVARVHYCAAARLLAVLLEDGRAGLCRMADAGIHPVELAQLVRWVYKPSAVTTLGTAPVLAVAAAVNPIAQMLAVGLSNGRVALYPMQNLLTLRQHTRPGNRVGIDTASVAPAGHHPDPLRILSLSDWGYSSVVVGPAAALEWSADGRALAVGYALRGMAVWTPSGCRLMCSLRQTAPGTAVGLQPHGTPQHDRGVEGDLEAAEKALMSPPPLERVSLSLPSPEPRGLLSQPSLINPNYTNTEPGVLEVGCWGGA